MNEKNLKHAWQDMRHDKEQKAYCNKLTLIQPDAAEINPCRS